jgi:tetratricopeptide (TPR) repeat protein
MSKILFAWELGAGLGHIAPCRGLFEKLCGRGHSLTLVLHDLSRAKNVFEGLKLAVLQAPVKTNLPRNPAAVTTSFVHVLHDSGYEDAVELDGMVQGWHSIFELTRPDLVIADYSPTALLALRGLPTRKMTIGCGFLIPPDTYPLQNLRPWQSVDEAALKRDEDQICQRVNSVLVNRRHPLDRLGQLFSDVDDSVLTTYPELDHYSERKGGVYWGLRRGFRGADFDWPAGSGPKVFAYLTYNPHADAMLQLLKDSGNPTIVCCSELPLETQKKFETEHLRFERRLLNVEKLAAECSLAVLNGNHDTACTLLLAGKPILFIPITLEHWIFAVSVQKIGAGLLAGFDRPAEFAPKFSQLSSCVSAAQRFATRYAQNDPAQLEDILVARVEEILKPDWQRRPMQSPLKSSGESLGSPSSAGKTEAETRDVTISPLHTKEKTLDKPAVAVSAQSSQALNTALEHHRQGRLEQAAQMYAEVLAQEPSNAAALHLMGVVYLQTAQFERAVDLIGRAISINSKESSFHSNLGEALRNLGQFERAIECFLTALRLRPEYPEACNNLGLVLQAQGKHKAAASRFREAIKLNPRYVMAYNNLGKLLGEVGQFEEARECFAKAQQAAKAE